MKKIGALLIVAIVFFNSYLPIYAQGEVADAWTELQSKSNNEFQSFKLKGEVTISSESQGRESELAFIESDMMVSDDPLGFQVLLDIVSPMAGEPIQLQMYGMDGVTYSYNSQEDKWSQKEWSMSDKEIREQINEVFNPEKTDTEITEEQSAFQDKYYKVEDDGDHYTFTLKENIDGKEFYQDFDKAYDVESILDKSFEQSEDQLDDKQKDEYIENAKKIFNEESFGKFFALKPNLEVSYDKKTGHLMNVELSIDADTELFKENMPEEQAQFLPEKLMIQASFQASEYGENVEISVPKEALDSVNTEEIIEDDASNESEN